MYHMERKLKKNKKPTFRLYFFSTKYLRNQIYVAYIALDYKSLISFSFILYDWIVITRAFP